MKLLNALKTQALKLFKGLFAITILLMLITTSTFIFESCKKNNYDNSNIGKTAKNFNENLGKSKTGLASISAKNNIGLEYIDTTLIPFPTYYLVFPTGTSSTIIEDFSSNITLESLTYVLENYNAEIFDTLVNNADVVFQMPENDIREMLNPLATDAVNYLLSKGATNQDILDLLEEEDCEKIDLIPFVKALVSIEQNQYAVKNIAFPGITEANAGFLSCGIAALGADALAALAHSSASSWTWGAMKSAFKSIAKKFLGPVGVAIAVVSFAVCMLN